MPDNEYPPQCTESCISASIGQFNDFSGPEEQEPIEESAPIQEAKIGLARIVAGDSYTNQVPVPVFITGSRPPSSNHFPGLRETMIASAIIQFAEEIPDDNSVFREAIIETAELLHRAGADKILRNKVVRRKRNKKC